MTNSLVLFSISTIRLILYCGVWRLGFGHEQHGRRTTRVLGLLTWEE